MNLLEYIEFITEEEAEPQVIKAIGAVTKEPSVQNYLNKNSYYSAAAPKDVNTAVTRAGLDHADDMFDTVDIKDGKDAVAEFFLETGFRYTIK